MLDLCLHSRKWRHESLLSRLLVVKKCDGVLQFVKKWDGDFKFVEKWDGDLSSVCQEVRLTRSLFVEKRDGTLS